MWLHSGKSRLRQRQPAETRLSLNNYVSSQIPPKKQIGCRRIRGNVFFLRYWLKGETKPLDSVVSGLILEQNLHDCKNKFLRNKPERKDFTTSKFRTKQLLYRLHTNFLCNSR